MKKDIPFNGDKWHLSEPFWRSKRIFGEPLFFIRENSDLPPKAQLIFRPTNALQITSASRDVLYSETSDYIVDTDTETVTLPQGSKIPFTDKTDLYRNLQQERTIAHKLGKEEVGLYFSEGRYFHDLQAEASYEHNSMWQHSEPKFQGDLLPTAVAKLEAGAPLTICVCGDSISAGGNASGFTDAPPNMPPYPELFAEELRRRFQSQITLKSFAVGGKGVEHGLEVVDGMIEENPDLVLIAYGMNNVSYLPAAEYRDTVVQIMNGIRAGIPTSEFILVASMLGNPEWEHTPTECFFPFRDVLKSLCTEGVALADMTQVWADLLQFKSYHDLTGNGVNHPNDFCHRIYAQVILDSLAKGVSPKKSNSLKDAV